MKHPLTVSIVSHSRLRAGEHALLLVLRDAELLRRVRLQRRAPGYRLVGHISRWWWLTLGLRHLWIRHKVKSVLPLVRETCGFTLGVDSLWIL